MAKISFEKLSQELLIKLDVSEGHESSNVPAVNIKESRKCFTLF
jgi:hypothetical protein